MKLALNLIRMDGGTQPREVLNYDVIDEYAEQMASGSPFSAITVYYDGESYWLADGFHRVKAAQQNAYAEIEANVIQGTLEDARWFSFGANQGHGLRRTNEDKRRAVIAALNHPQSQLLSNVAIARHLGVDEGTLRSWRDKLSSENPKIAEHTRTVTRNGSTYQQNSTNIGRKPVDNSAGAPSAPRAIQIPVIDRKAVWACQMRKNFEKELLRLIKAYEKSNPPVDALVVMRSNGIAVGIEIASSESEVTA